MLETLFDSNETIFKYNSKVNSFSLIQADYFLKNKLKDKSVYVFLSAKSDDYTKNQPKWALLFKKKIDLISGTEIVLYDRMR